MIMVNTSLRELYFAGKIVYVHGLLCINDPQYVEYDENGIVSLTDIARDNVAVCCFRFNRDLSASKDYSDTYYRMCYLCRDLKDIEYVNVGFDLTTNADLIQDAGVISEKMGALHKAISEIKDLSFSETLKYHMMGKNITNEVLAAICETTTQTVSSWRNIKDDLSVKIGLALCLCNALRLHPEYSRDLISKANYNLYRQIPQNAIVRMLIDSCIGYSIEEWEAILKETNTGIIMRSWKE